MKLGHYVLQLQLIGDEPIWTDYSTYSTKEDLICFKEHYRKTYRKSKIRFRAIKRTITTEEIRLTSI